VGAAGLAEELAGAGAVAEDLLGTAPPGSQAAEALRLLRVVGLQNMAAGS